MKAKEALLCWDYNSDRVKVIKLPNEPVHIPYQCTGMAAYTSIQNATEKEIRLVVFQQAILLMLEEKCDPVAVDEAFKEIDEYRNGWYCWGESTKLLKVIPERV